MKAFRGSHPRRVRFGGFLVGAAVAGLAMFAASPLTDPIGVIVHLQGDVTVATAEDAAPARATVGMSLRVGDRLEIAPRAEATVLYRNGRVERFTRSAVLASTAQPRAEGLLARAVRTLTELASTDVRMQPNRQGMIRPLPGAAVAVAPRNDILLSTGRPTFTWTAVQGATAYRLQIQPQDRPPSRYFAGRDTVWALPDSEPLLKPGPYAWTVAPAPAGRPAASQRFRVATIAELAVLQGSLDAIAAAGLDPATDGLLAAATVYRDGGYLYEARDALDRLAASTEVSREVHLLRAEVLAAVGDGQGAAAALALAGAAPARKE